MARRSSSLFVVSLTVALAALALCAGVHGVDAQATTAAPVVSYSFLGHVLDANGGNALTGPPPTFTADRCGNVNGALVFPGGDYYRTSSVVSALPRGDSSRTQAAWIRCNATGLNTRSIVQFGSRVSGQNSALVVNDRQINFYTEIGGDPWPGTSATPCTGGWVHVAAVYDQGTHKLSLFVNGAAVITVSSSALSTPASALNLGFYPSYDGAIFVGAMDSASVYNVALSSAQITSLYQEACQQCTPYAWSASTTGASSSLALGNSSAVTPSWSVACFSAANTSVSPCATNFRVGLYDSASGELVKTLFASPSYCPRAGQVDVGSSFGAPDGSYAGRAFYLQATHVVGSAVVTLGAPLRYTVVCAAAESAQASPVSLPGLSYTGALSGSSSEFLYAEATLPFTSAADLPVGGQFSFTLDNGASCSSPSSINGSLSVGSCRLSTPTAAGFYNVAVRFEAQTDRCTLFVAQTSVSIQVLDLQVLQAQADATVGALNAETARATAAEAAVQANVARETARAIAAEVTIQQNFTAGLAQAAADRAAGDAALAAQLSAEVSRASSTELELRSLIKDLSGAVGALTARVTTLERPAAYLFFGLANALSVSYPRGQQPGSGPANMLRKPLIFDTPLSSLGNDSLTYSPTTGQLRITAAGTYRFDAFVHLYVSQGNTVGTGVVSWQTAAGRPIGPNVLNENSNGVAQGVPGDDSLVSSLRTISASELPFTAQLVLVSMNQREATITDASVISVTRVR